MEPILLNLGFAYWSTYNFVNRLRDNWFGGISARHFNNSGNIMYMILRYIVSEGNNIIEFDGGMEMIEEAM